MAQLLFKLRGVPVEEQEEIRQLLADHQIDYYETPTDKWGVSMPAIWVVDDTKIDEAKQLLHGHHQEYADKHKHESAHAREPIINYWLNRPITILGYVALILFILYLVISPFISFMESS